MYHIILLLLLLYSVPSPHCVTIDYHRPCLKNSRQPWKVTADVSLPGTEINIINFQRDDFYT